MGTKTSVARVQNGYPGDPDPFTAADAALLVGQSARLTVGRRGPALAAVTVTGVRFAATTFDLEMNVEGTDEALAAVPNRADYSIAYARNRADHSDRRLTEVWVITREEVARKLQPGGALT